MNCTLTLTLGALLFATAASAQTPPTFSPADLQAALNAQIQAAADTGRERSLLIANVAIAENRRADAEKRAVAAEKRADDAEAKLKAVVAK